MLLALVLTSYYLDFLMSMKLKLLTIRNFRGIDSLDKLEISNLNTLVGKNDAGKSAILRALDCFFDPRKFSSKDVFKGKPEQETTAIELSFLPPTGIDDLALDSNGLITIKKEFCINNGKPKTTEYYLCNDFTKEKYQDLWNKKEQDLNQLIEEFGQEANRSGRGKKNVLRIEQLKTILTGETRLDIYHEIGDFLSNIEKTYNLLLPGYSLFDAEQDLDIEATNFQAQFKPIILSYFESTKAKTDDIEKGLKSGLATEFEEIRKYMAKNVSGLKKLNPSTEFDWSKSLKKFDLNLEFEGQNFDVSISHKGTGFKRLLMVAYFEYLANKKDVQNQIFAIEEPETYLHPSAQEDLLNSIIRISGESQFFLTTHSPIFAGATNGKNSILVTKDELGVSHYEKGDEGIIDQIINELGIRPDHALLKQSSYLIFVEGQDDVLFLRIIAKKILNKDLQADKVICMIGGGSSLKNCADLDLFKQINGNNKYAVFVDGDNGDVAKEKEKAKIKQRCDADGALFHKLSKREIENYCCPDKIKQCYINDIISREGALTQNPFIPKISSMNIKITDDLDTEEYLKGLGLKPFKNGINIKVFESMTKEEFEVSDDKGELSGFLKMYI